MSEQTTLEQRVSVLEKEIAELKGQVSVRAMSYVLPGSVVWFANLKEEIDGIKDINVTALSEPGCVQLLITLEGRAVEEITYTKLAEVIQKAGLAFTFHSIEVVFLRVVMEKSIRL